MKKQKNKLLSKLMLILVLVISCCIKSITSIGATSDNTQKMTEEELLAFTEMFNMRENNGFLASTYSRASEINLNIAFRECGTELIENQIEEEERNDILDLLKIEFFNIPVFKLTEKQITDLYVAKTGENITNSNIQQRLTEWFYSEKYNAYYTMHGDSSYQEVKCISGEKDSNGIYKVIYQSAQGKKYAFESGKTSITTDIDKMVVTMQKKGNDYIFISNNIYKDNTENDQVENTKDNIVEDTTKKADQTTAKKTTLPKAGKDTVILLVIALSIVLGIVLITKLYKYRNIK